MKTDPKLTESRQNRLWIKFFLTAVYGTMWVRDHQRPVFHEALGVDVTWYGLEVFRKTSEISKQIYPFTLDIDHPRFRKGLDKLQDANVQIAAGKRQRGVAGKIKQFIGTARAAAAFAVLYSIPVVHHERPASTMMEPAY